MTEQIKPEWLKQELFDNVLKTIESNYTKISNFNVCNATAPGENYATRMLRILIEMELKNGMKRPISFVMKTPIKSEQSARMANLMTIFEKEETIYTDVIPELEQLYRDVGVDVKFSGRRYDLPTPSNVERLLLEDLCPRGFKNANRIIGLDMDHTKSVLKKLAQWHAASAVRVERKGQYDHILTQGPYVEDTKPIFRNLINTVTASMRKCMLSYDGHTNWIGDVDALRQNITDAFFKMVKVDNQKFNVLNHGDCWANNIMFQYDASDKIKEVYFVDFQMPQYGSPAQDLYYFLLSSTQYEIKIKQFDYFIKYYHDNLVENLKILRYAKPLPTLKQLHHLLYQHDLWAYSTITGVMAIVLLDPSENANHENIFSDTTEGVALKMSMYSNPRYRKHMEALLPWLQNRGAMES